jgi:ABC-type multidrug transport system fused ATPase/permease subunit
LLVLSYITVLATMSWPLLVAAVVIFGFLAFLQRVINARVRALSKQLSESSTLLSREIVENVTGLRIIHTFGAWGFRRQRMAAIQESIIDATGRLIRRMSLLAPISDSVMLLAIGAFLLVGFFVFRTGNASFLPELVTFVVVLNRVSTRMTNLANAMSQISQKLGTLSILDELFTDEGKVFVRTTGAPLTAHTHNIELKGVHLAYEERGEDALGGIDLRLTQGTVTALVGPSGAGKSSVADLVTGLYEPTRGGVFIDGVDLRGVSPADWVRRVAVSRRTRCCSTTRCARTSALVAPMRATPTSSRPGASRTSTTSWRRCRSATTRWWASAASCSRVDSGSVCRSHARSFVMPKC